jgi:hypothetical protein
MATCFFLTDRRVSWSGSMRFFDADLVQCVFLALIWMNTFFFVLIWGKALLTLLWKINALGPLVGLHSVPALLRRDVLLSPED